MPGPVEKVVRKVIGAIPWRKLTLEEARELALRGEHLARTKAGQYVGAPRGVESPQALAALRKRLDAAAEEGAFGANWYEQARAGTREMSGGDPKLAQELAAGQAVYSVQASPETALGWTLAQKNRSLLEGPKKAGERNYHYGRQAKQFREVLEGGDPERTLGPKTGPYYRQINPEDEAASAVGVNDRWMGRLYGYKGKSKGGDPARGGFSESEHSFMTGENLQARERADLAGTFPEGTPKGAGPFQAASWVGARARALRAKYPEMPEDELRRRAASNVPEALEKYTAQETTEVIPSRGSKHLEGAVDLPLPKRQQLAEQLRPQRAGEPDPYYEALGMPQRPAQAGLGQFTEAVADDGPVRFQPAFLDKASGKVHATEGFHDAGQLPRDYEPDEWVEGFVDQRGKFYTREEAGAVANRPPAEAPLELPSRSPLRSNGDVLPYLGSAERAAYEKRYMDNVREMRGAPGVEFSESDIPIDRIFGGHEVHPGDKASRTRLYTRGYKEGAPPNRLLVFEDPPSSGNFFVLDGNRRLQAAKAAGLDRVPAVIEHPVTPLTSERLTTRETHGGQPPAPRTDYNPSLTTKPMVSYEAGARGRPAKDIRVAEPEREMLQGVNALRSATDVQAAGAYHVVKPTTTPRLQNAARVQFQQPLDEEWTALLYDHVNASGLNLIDTGGGTFTVVGDFGSMPAGKFRAAFAPLAREFEENGAKVTLGTYAGQYNELPQYGEGRVTKYLLEQVTPRVGVKLNTPKLRSQWLGRNKAEAEAASRFELGAPRKDVQRLRVLLAKGGPEGLRKHVAKLGYGGLPALAAGTREESR